MPQLNTPQPGRRIAVLGTSGCGKTYVARRLAEVLGVPYVCSDAILWGPNWTWKTAENQMAGYDLATRGDAWTFDGNLGNVTKAENAMVMGRVDTLVWLDLAFWRLFSQLFVRTVRRAWTGEELWHGNRESWRISFLSSDSILIWAIRTFRSNRRRYAEHFADPSSVHLKKIRFTRRRDLNAWLALLEEQQANA